MNRVNAVVLRTAGVNCNKETVFALELAGAYRVDEIHINRLKKNKKILDKYHFMVIPGGFSYGDYVAAGKIFANELKYIIFDQIKRFVEKGKIIFGICNGFQILVRSGLLSTDEKNYTQTFSLIDNDSRRFECRWVYLKTNRKSKILEDLPDVIYLPIAHNEGKFVADNSKSIRDLKVDNRIAFQYSMPDGSLNNIIYPFNPNGALENIAGITNSEGNILGLMPHPERFVLAQQHPYYNYLKEKNIKIEPYGLKIFKKGVKLS